MKRFSHVILVVAAVVALSLTVIEAPPAPSTLASITGKVRSDYVDRAESRKIYYTVVAADGTQCEVWTREDNLDRSVRLAAIHAKELTVWYEPDGELWAAPTDFDPPH